MGLLDGMQEGSFVLDESVKSAILLRIHVPNEYWPNSRRDALHTLPSGHYQLRNPDESHHDTVHAHGSGTKHASARASAEPGRAREGDFDDK